MMNPAIKLGRWLFRHRSITPLPMIVIVLVCFSPRHYGDFQPWVTIAGVALSLLGETVRVLSVGFAHTGTSGRESYLRADALNTTGAYSLVRNPLYIGNTLIHCGILVFWGNPWALVLMVGFLWVQYALIILGEESFLIQQHGGSYDEYRSRVPRIVPKPGNYRRPDSPFQWRKVLLKENDSVFNMLAMFLILQALRGHLLAGEIPDRTFLIVTAAFLIAVYGAFKVWKKQIRGNRPSRTSSR